ncbi:MAG: Gfo/Idh/MocA family oxidoreductase, partial [Verrucomicrobiota bacterium]
MVKVAIVGAGAMAREHVRAFAALPDVEVTGIHSRTPARAQQLAAEFSIPHVSESVDALKSSSGADLVVVAVPELEANKVAKAAFSQDWNVLLEKPAGYDLADAEDIAASAKQAGRQVFVGFNRRFYSSTLETLADLEQRAERRFIHIQDQQSF